jgi:hypothetical protein
MAAHPEPRAIDWASAEIDGGTLTVDLSGRSSKAWRTSFGEVLRVLQRQGSDRWPDVKLGKATLEVAPVSEGSESELRHFLESVVLQANSTLGSDAGEEQPVVDGDPERALDQKMTMTFRAFAEPPSSEDS